MAVIAQARLWAPPPSLPPDASAAQALLDAVRRRQPPCPGRWQQAPEPDRPASVPGGAWRRMSRLSRMVLATATPLLEERPDRETIPVIWGNAMGELVPIGRFLERLYVEGPEHCSPLNFQNSVTNAPAGHLSIALGLHGLSETISAGGATGLVALARGLDLLALGRARAVLVVAGDDLNEVTQQAWTLQGDGPRVGEAVAAVLLQAEGEGPKVEVRAGIHAQGEVFCRRASLPLELPLPQLDGATPLDDSLGLVPSGGLALVAALALTGARGCVVDFDGTLAYTARVTP